MSDVAKTPREELECKKKYLYEYSMFWECNDGFKSQILEDDVVDLLNEQQEMIDQLEKENKQLRKTIALFEVEEDEINFLKEVVVVDDE